MNDNLFKSGDIIVANNESLHFLIVNVLENSYQCISSDRFAVVNLPIDESSNYVKMEDYSADIPGLACVFNLTTLPKNSIPDIISWLQANLITDRPGSLIPPQIMVAQKMALKTLDCLGTLEKNVMKEVCKHVHVDSIPACIGNTASCDKSINVSEVRSCIQTVLKDIIMEISEVASLTESDNTES